MIFNFMAGKARQKPIDCFAQMNANYMTYVLSICEYHMHWVIFYLLDSLYAMQDINLGGNENGSYYDDHVQRLSSESKTTTTTTLI
jgi:hypothetical protein